MTASIFSVNNTYTKVITKCKQKDLYRPIYSNSTVRLKVWNSTPVKHRTWRLLSNNQSKKNLKTQKTKLLICSNNAFG